MADAIFVRVEAEKTATGGRTFEIWIVATNDPDEAVAAVRAMVSPTREVEAIYDRPSEETIKRLALLRLVKLGFSERLRSRYRRASGLGPM